MRNNYTVQELFSTALITKTIALPSFIIVYRKKELDSCIKCLPFFELQTMMDLFFSVYFLHICTEKTCKRRCIAFLEQCLSNLIFQLRLMHLAVLGTFLFIFAFFLPSLIFWSLEPGWSFLDCLYFVFISLTTIGQSPNSSSSSCPSSSGPWSRAGSSWTVSTLSSSPSPP
jgi:hypothetical protein